MKKLTLFLTILMTTGLAKAQYYTYDSLVNLDFGWYGYDVRNFLELRDGNIVSYSPFCILDDDFNIIGDLGDVLVKVSPNACFLDSTLMVNDYANHCLLERNPQSDGNLFVKIVRDFENIRTSLLIRHFDDNLMYDETQDIVVPLEDTLVTASERYLLENDENIIVMYNIGSGPDIYYPVTPIMVRMGLDGTIKDRVELPDTLIGYYTGWSNNLQVYKDSPREYVWSQTEYGSRERFGFFVVDSLFRLKEYHRVEEAFEPGYTMGFSGEEILPSDEHSYLVYSRFYNNEDVDNNGVRITKYDKISHDNLGSVKFRTKQKPMYENFTTCAIPCDLKKSADGNLYFVYSTADRLAQDGFYVGVVKLDNDLNVIWQRYCLSLGKGHEPNLALCLEGGGLVVGGFERGFSSGHIPIKMFFLFFHEDGTSISESEAQIRPYLFWPNPAQDQLRLQYSPDVKPAQIELFDIQGRLVKTQRNGLESLNLQGLSAGTYTMRVTLEGGKVFSDKVVKE